MAKRMTTGQREALELLYEARDMVRGPLRTAIETAIDIGENGHRSDLTNMSYDRLRPGQKLTDPKRPGLVMRCGSLKRRYWLFRTTEPNSLRQIEIPIGSYPDISIEEARQAWQKLRDLRKQANAVLTENVGEKRRPIPANRLLEMENLPTTMTMGDLVARYLSDYAQKVKRSWAEDERILTRHILKKYENTPVASLEAHTITLIIHNLHDRAPREAEKLMAAMSTLFNVAKGKTKKIKITEPWLPDELPNPIQSVPSLPSRKAESYTPSPSELRAYADNLHQLGDPYADALILQLQTCSRISEAAKLPWSEVDLEEGVWTLAPERSKNGLAHKVMLSTQSLQLLSRRKEANPGSPFIFPSKKYPDEPVSPETAMKQISANRAALGIHKRFTSHSTRHGMLTWMAENEFGKEIRDRISNHKPPATSIDSVYTKAAELNRPARLALQTWANFLDGTDNDNVVRIGPQA